jgi:hypothetical protein
MGTRIKTNTFYYYTFKRKKYDRDDFKTNQNVELFELT